MLMATEGGPDRGDAGANSSPEESDDVRYPLVESGFRASLIEVMAVVMVALKRGFDLMHTAFVRV